MKCKGIFALGVFSLFLVGTAEKAAWASVSDETKTQNAQDTTRGFDTGDGHVRIFGKTLCAADAPAIVECDWRMPKVSGDAPAEIGPETRKVSILGKNICFGPTSDSESCWLQFPAVKRQDERRAGL